MAKKLSRFPATSRGLAAAVVQQVLANGGYTNIVLNKYLRQTQLSELERRLATELVYGTVKACGTLDWYLEHTISRPLAQVAPELLAILRISVFQLQYLERIPAPAVCNEAVELARAVSHEGGAKFVNGVLRGLLRQRKAGQLELPAEAEDDAGYLALKYAHPRWLVKRWLGPWGREGTEKLLAFNNSAAPVCLRVNTLVTTRERLLTALRELGAEARPSQWSADGIVCTQLPALQQLLQQLPGQFYIQDESSMLVAPLLALQPGLQVLDLCSAPGGKATHCAQLLKDQGRVVACDIHEHKLKLLVENAERLGLHCLQPELNDALQLREEWLQQFDRVLVDAPCSGMGVLRRRAEARWRKQRQDLKLFPPLQLAILKNAVSYVKPGGRLVYSTCTIEQSEDHYLIEAFLAEQPEWRRVPFAHPLSGEAVEELQLLPQRDGIDGFYICILERR